MADDHSARNPVGRPPLDPNDPSVQISLRLPTKTYDAIYRRARGARMSVPDYLRAHLGPATARRSERDGD